VARRWAGRRVNNSSHNAGAYGPSYILTTKGKIMTKEHITKEQARIREEISDLEIAITEHELEIKGSEIYIKCEEEEILKVRNKIAVLMRDYHGLKLEAPAKKAKVKNAK
jgi:hypothetical protein